MSSRDSPTAQVGQRLEPDDVLLAVAPVTAGGGAGDGRGEPDPFPVPEGALRQAAPGDHGRDGQLLVHVTEYREPEVLQVKRGSAPTAISHIVRSEYRCARLLGHPRIGAPAAPAAPAALSTQDASRSVDPSEAAMTTNLSGFPLSASAHNVRGSAI